MSFRPSSTAPIFPNLSPGVQFSSTRDIRSLGSYPKSKCGDEGLYLDCFDVQKELLAKRSRTTKGLLRARSQNDHFLPRLHDARKDTGARSSSSDSEEDARFGTTDEHAFKSPAPRPLGSILARDITVDLMRFRRLSLASFPDPDEEHAERSGGCI